MVQDFLPLLGDIALAAHGDATARALAEAALPVLEQGGWRISAATQRIWAGECDAAALTAGLDPNSSVLVRRILGLVTDGPDMILVADAIQISELRRQADAATAQVLASGDAGGRAELVVQLEDLAGQVEQNIGVPWQELADHLRVLAARLRVGG